MKILILVLSCQDPPYDLLQKAQQETWDRVSVEGVETKYYFPKSVRDMFSSLKEILNDVWLLDWDYIFRTNSSSYVHKPALVEFAKQLPKQKCYCGLDGGGFASGSGMFLSRDVVDSLRNNVHPVGSSVEDEQIGEVLSRVQIGVTPGAKRYDYYFEEFQKSFYGKSVQSVHDHYHFRCKSDTVDRMKDVWAMETVHKMKNGGR